MNNDFLDMLNTLIENPPSVNVARPLIGLLNTVCVSLRDVVVTYMNRSSLDEGKTKACESNNKGKSAKKKKQKKKKQKKKKRKNRKH